MSIYHRRLDHEWNTARRETNYALFGNAGGRDAPAKLHTGGYEALTKDEAYFALWRKNVRYGKLSRHYNKCQGDYASLSGDAKREYDLAWLRYRET